MRRAGYRRHCGSRNGRILEKLGIPANDASALRQNAAAKFLGRRPEALVNLTAYCILMLTDIFIGISC